jgi:hypothetical protein
LAELQEIETKQLPRRLNGSTSWTEARVGFLSLTRVFQVATPQGKGLNLRALEDNIRRDSCSGKNRRMIENGASYRFEYRNSATGELIEKLEIASCS